MKNYLVKAIKEFDDYEGAEIKPENPKTKRIVGAIFNCTKERYEYLKENNAVELVGIDEIKKEVPEIKNVDETIKRIEESAKETVALQQKPKNKKKTSKK